MGDHAGLLFQPRWPPKAVLCGAGRPLSEMGGQFVSSLVALPLLCVGPIGGPSSPAAPRMVASSVSPGAWIMIPLLFLLEFYDCPVVICPEPA